MDTKKGITASTVENVYRCRRCGEVYSRKLDALACKHEKLIDDEVIISLINGTRGEYGARIIVKHSGYQLISFSLDPGWMAGSSPDRAIAFAESIIKKIKRAKIVVRKKGVMQEGNKILVVRVAEKLSKEAINAMNISSIHTPIDFLRRLKRNNRWLRDGTLDDRWVIFSIGGKQSKYVILAKIFSADSEEVIEADKRRFHCVKCCYETITQYAKDKDGDGIIKCLIDDYSLGWRFTI